MDFLPKDYKVPETGGNYMKFKTGENRFRILDNPILGWEGWKTQPDGSLRPVRVHLDDSLPVDAIDDAEKVKHFWAMPVWNYSEKKVQILEITQKTILRTLQGLTEDKEWGSPLNYDISVVKTGDGMETKYQLIPAPPKPLIKEISDEYSARPIDLDALFKGGDPFAKAMVDEIDKALGI